VLREVARVETISSSESESSREEEGGEGAVDVETWREDLLDPKDPKVVLGEKGSEGREEKRDHLLRHTITD
jgi:hypothetical protein